MLILASSSLLNYREYLAGEADNTTLDTSVDATALLAFRMVQSVKNCTATPIVELCTAHSSQLGHVMLIYF